MRTKAYLKSMLFMSVFFLALVSTAMGRTIFVDPDATGTNDGSRWINAYNYLQDALITASSGDQIKVAEGVYKPDQGEGITPGDRSATFQLENGVAIIGGYAGFGQPNPDTRDIIEYETILSGDLNGDDGPDFANNEENSYHVVAGSGSDETAVLNGFTITAGNADDILHQPDINCGGGLYNERGSPTIVDCTFCGNYADYAGGAVHNMEESSPTLTNCSFIENSAQDGGGMWNFVMSSPVITNCTFIGNHADSRGGGIYNQGECGPKLINCKILGNTAGVEMISYGDGGGMYNRDGCYPLLINCIIAGNSAKGGQGGGIYSRNLKINSRIILTNCTLTGNSAPRGNAFACDSLEHRYPSRFQLTNCILWDGYNQIWNQDNSPIKITYSDVQGGWADAGNIDVNPLFIDADGADDIFGTDDDNLRLLPESPCIDAGDNSALPESVRTDLDGNPRIINGIVDMGAYEFRSLFNWYVNAADGDDNNDGSTLEAAFATIQKGIDSAKDSDTVLVYPGVYTEEIVFLGKAITIQGVATTDGVPVLQNPDDFAVSLYYGEGPDSILKNFVIKDSFMAIFIAGSSPTITNVTIVNNKYGIEAYAGADPNISNCIFWNNTISDLFQCEARYSCTKPGFEGQGNIHPYPWFVDPVNEDYHLLSQRGRYWFAHDVWVLDSITSPCIDAGDPTVDPSGEPMPNGGRINMGAYGGTPYASMSEMVWLDGDINHDGIVDIIDFAMLADNWLRVE
jgi:parallel beta-helix repeat protein